MRLFLHLVLSVCIFFGSLWGLLIIWGNLSRPDTYVQLTVLKRGGDVRAPLVSQISLMPPDSEIRHDVQTGNGKISSTYQINGYGLRESDNGNAAKKSHLLLSGCSFIFGDELPLEETVSDILGKVHPEMNVRNLGFHGGGLNTALRMFELIPLREIAPEEKGIFIYNFIHLHYSRFFFHPSYLSWAPPLHPAYKFRDGELISSGHLRDYFMYQMVSSLPSKLIHFLRNAKQGVDYPDNQIDEFADGVFLLKKRYLRIYPKGRFIWLIDPQFPLPDWMEKKLRERAIMRGIELVDGRIDFKHHLKTTGTKRESYHIQHDLHPNGRFNRYFAQWISSSLLSQ